MVQRVESLLEELEARHGAGQAFMDQLRPVVERIFNPGTPEESRPHLLELVAEACERQVELTHNCEVIRAALANCANSIAEVIARLEEKLSRNEGD